MLLRMMRATLTASDPMAAFERIGAAALPVPKAMSTMSAKHLVSGAADLKPQPHLRIVK